MAYYKYSLLWSKVISAAENGLDCRLCYFDFFFFVCTADLIVMLHKAKLNKHLPPVCRERKDALLLKSDSWQNWAQTVPLHNCQLA